MVFSLAGDVDISAHQATVTAGLTVPAGPIPPRTGVFKLDSVENLRDKYRGLGVPEPALELVMASQANSTRAVYGSQWGAFCDWCSGRDIHPLTVTLTQILDFLQSRWDMGLAPGTLKVYCSALTCYLGHVEGFTVATHPMVKRWLQGAWKRRPPTKTLVPSWDLQFVLRSLMLPPYEPLSRVSLKYLTLKTVFLLAVTSAARRSELHALDCRPELTVITDNWASLRHNPAFKPKVLLPANLERTIELTAFKPSLPSDPDEEVGLRTLCPVRCLRYYCQATKELRQPGKYQLLVSFDSNKLGFPVSRDTVSRWLKTVVQDAYSSSELPVPKVKGHSTSCLLYTSPSPRDLSTSRMPSSA